MPSIIFKAAEGAIADKQFRAVYALAEKLKVGIVLYGASGGHAPVHHFLVEGSVPQVARFLRAVPAVFPHAVTDLKVWLTMFRR